MWDRSVRHARILLADDQEHMRTLLRECFENVGYEVDSVEHGDLALERLGMSRPDVLILDLMGQGIDGTAILDWLKERDDAPPVVVLAGGGDQGCRPAPEGAAAVLRRPFTFPVLLGICDALVATQPRGCGRAEPLPSV